MKKRSCAAIRNLFATAMLGAIIASVPMATSAQNTPDEESPDSRVVWIFGTDSSYSNVISGSIESIEDTRAHFERLQEKVARLKASGTMVFTAPNAPATIVYGTDAAMLRMHDPCPLLGVWVTPTYGLADLEFDQDRSTWRQRSGAEGIEVVDIIDGSGASAAGILSGDRILAINGNETSRYDQLRTAVVGAGVGASVTVEIMRDDEVLTVEATIGADPRRPNCADEPSTIDSRSIEEIPEIEGIERDLIEKLESVDFSKLTPGEGTSWMFRQTTAGDKVRLGVSVQSMPEQLARHFGLEEGERGVLIAEILPGTPAERAGLAAGDVVVRIADTSIESPADLLGAVRNAPNSTTVIVVRNGERVEVPVTFLEQKTDSGDTVEDRSKSLLPDADLELLDRNSPGLRAR